ncbi:forkhead box protein G1 [Thalictrum thalictroides]|uniref:Forkhead box protein G1 n=1 Tax=Thalictrum thalictroides TaxID=46969 RepID=A0A7J6UUP6_THATH|nr:forkhead box protein G1 [Thalictrum thalictroides]KAF5179034.1 forkhead box protein G1 [Thalictrum thalictroides]
MPYYFIPSICRQISIDRPILLYTAIWTFMLMVTVALASFSPEYIFVRMISPSSSFSQACKTVGYVRIPLDLPGEVFCFPANFFRKSSADFFVPSVFAALIVAGSACVVRAIGLWEYHSTDRIL